MAIDWAGKLETSVTRSAAAVAEPEQAELIVSADSHVIEPFDLWERELPPSLRGSAPRFDAKRNRRYPGGFEGSQRRAEMARDGISAEVLYPTLGLELFGLDDANLQEACFRVYNDWLIDYCKAVPDRLLGVPSIAIYDVDVAIAELERCYAAGLKGALIWQAPHPDLPIYSEHYNRFWEVAQELGAPISMHILSGHNYSKNRDTSQAGPERYRGSVNLKLHDAINGLFDLIFYGVLDRYPRLKFILVENEIGWLPFFLQQWDYYFKRFRDVNPLDIDQLPSTYFDRQVYATFFNDAAGTRNLAWWGADNCMWSNDFPHPNSTWPNSRQVIARDLAGLPEETRSKLLWRNVAALYGLELTEHRHA